jgi:hypothetical protein
MQFCRYLKHCREHFGLTQEEMVTHLYHAHESFEGLDAVTLSRWERCQTYPGIERQKQFILAMHRYSDAIFPCWEILPLKEVEEEMYAKGIRKVIGKHKRFILDFPADLVEESRLCFTEASTLNDPSVYIELTRTFINKITDHYIDIDENRFRELALHPGSFFLLATYQQQFFGVVFSIKLNRTTFRKLMNKEISENEIEADDLVSVEEHGYEYPFTFFAYTEQTATILALRYYAHLLKNQHSIVALGSLPKSTEGRRLVETLGLREESPAAGYPKVYSAAIEEVLLNRYILQMLFRK